MAQIFIFLALLLLAEFYLIGQIMDEWGVLPTLLTLVLTGMVGGRLVKREGINTARTLAIKLQEGTPVGLELVEGMLLLFAGFLFIFPGFISDLLALLLLLPLRRWLAVVVARALHGNQARYPSAKAGETIIEGEAIREAETTQPPLLSLPPTGNKFP
ncbi:MAG: FxsA family protein [Magnetococcales bacterium]|nr:FxsA family protein [Magnetococcales bacterium]